MSGWLKLAWHYVRFYRLKTSLLIACIFLTAFLPLLLSMLLVHFQQQLGARAAGTPLVVGAPGSGLELTLHALHFSRPPERTIPYGELASLSAEQWGELIPLHSRFRARGYPIVGTSLDYFAFRELEIQAGHTLTTLGDCLLGAEVAERLGLKPGNRLISDRENVLDIAGLYPLRMNVVGVLKPANPADDRAVFVDLKTAWIIEGLGHGHDDVVSETDDGKILQRDPEHVVASAAVLPYTEITEANRGSFHFHGELADFPLTAIVVRAADEKSETILLGRYQSTRDDAQIVIPRVVIEDLMSLVFRVKRFFDANTVLVSLATGCLLVLVILLSLRLRAGEMQTMFKLGCSRQTVWLLQIGELGFVVLAAGVLLALALAGSQWAAPKLVEQLLAGG